jgi:zinc transport system ATP-binding protein
MAEPIVKLENVWVWRGRHLALREVSLCIEAQKFIGLMGPNGGGKTTLLRVIAGLIKPQRGTVEVSGPVARTIGYVPQEENVDPQFPVSARDVVEMGLSASLRPLAGPSARQKEQVSHALSMVGMEALSSRRIGELSGGQKQRIFIARAIVAEPRLLLLDEPTTGVDAAARDDFNRLLQDLMNQMSLTILLASHDLEVVPTQVDEIICINQRVFVHAPPEAIEETDAFRKAYGCEIEFMTHGRHPHRVVERHPGEEKQDRQEGRREVRPDGDRDAG